jgi:hypothetical protein
MVPRIDAPTDNVIAKTSVDTRGDAQCCSLNPGVPARCWHLFSQEPAGSRREKFRTFLTEQYWGDAMRRSGYAYHRHYAEKQPANGISQPALIETHTTDVYIHWQTLPVSGSRQRQGNASQRQMRGKSLLCTNLPLPSKRRPTTDDFATNSRLTILYSSPRQKR